MRKTSLPVKKWCVNDTPNHSRQHNDAPSFIGIKMIAKCFLMRFGKASTAMDFS